MIDLKKRVEKKLLSEDCWIDLVDGLKIRVDYLTRSQETELRRLKTLWKYNLADPESNHWIEYYFRAAVKEIQGFTIEGQPAKLESSGGLAMSLINEKGDSVDVCGAFAELGILETACSLIRERLDFGELSKKN